MPRRHQRRLGTGFQKLEDRSLLAGNVTATLDQNTSALFIEGDIADNSIVVWRDVNTAQYIVAGAKDAAGLPTLVNGQAAPQQVFGGVTSIRFRLDQGNNRVLMTSLLGPAIDGLRFADLNIDFDGGPADDTLVIRGNEPADAIFELNQGDSIPYDRVSISGGVSFVDDPGATNGNDALRFFNVGIGGGISFSDTGGQGKDTLQIDGNGSSNHIPQPDVPAENNNLIGSLISVNMRNGNDQVLISRTRVRSDIRIHDTAGNAKVKFFNVEGIVVPGGVSPHWVIDVGVQNNFTGTVEIDGGRPGGPGRDDLSAGVYLSIITRGLGTNNITVHNAEFHQLMINASAGTDHVKVTNSQFDVLTALLKEGNDSLALGNVTERASTPGDPTFAYFDGGAGTDTYTDLGGNFIPDFTLVNFEPAPVSANPVLSLGGTLNYQRNAPGVVLASNATVTDSDSPNFAGGQLLVRIEVGAGTSNRLAIGSGFTVDSNGDVRQGTTIIGVRARTGIGKDDLMITFNGNATASVVQALTRSITYRNLNGSAGQRKIVFTVSDGDGGQSARKPVIVNVT